MSCSRRGWPKNRFPGTRSRPAAHRTMQTVAIRCIPAGAGRISRSRRPARTDRWESQGRRGASFDIQLQSVADRVTPLREPIFGSYAQRTQRRYFTRIANRLMPSGSGSCSRMRPEIAELVELLARAAYQRWRAGEFLLDVAFPQVGRVQNNQLPKTSLVAYDHLGLAPTTELLGCASTPTPDTAPIGKQKRR